MTKRKKFILLCTFISTGWYFTILLPPILFNLAKKVWDSLLQGPVGVSWISDSSKTLSSSNWGEKVKITLKRLFSLRLCLHKHFNESIAWNHVWGGFYASPSPATAGHFTQIKSSMRWTEQPVTRLSLIFRVTNWQHLQERHLSLQETSRRSFLVHLKPDNTCMSGTCDTAWHPCLGWIFRLLWQKKIEHNEWLSLFPKIYAFLGFENWHRHSLTVHAPYTLWMQNTVLYIW